MSDQPANESIATFAEGCFWQVEVDFRSVEGVIDVVVGYTGGSVAEPTYEQVCTGQTGHAEACEIRFDPERVSYRELLDIFWATHDPTQLNRQGPDIGSQYRSAIFFHDAEQEAEAIASRDATQEKTRGEVVTEIVQAGTFWPAEEYHQRYLERRGIATCRI